MSVAAPPITKLTNYINGQWTDSHASEWRDVVNPATGEVLASVPLADAPKLPPLSKPRPQLSRSGVALRPKTASSRCSS